jgi:AbrB family looped-hinge helix DNA binding protein
MRVTSKGQVTIPQAMREKFGLLPDTEVEFKVQGGQVVLTPAKKPGSKTRGQLLVEKMVGRGDINLTTDEIMAMTRGYPIPKPRKKAKRRA